MTIQNRYTGAFEIVANPENASQMIVQLELMRAEPVTLFDDQNKAVLTHARTHDMFGLCDRFKASDEGFRQQLLAEISGITDADAQIVVKARRALADMDQDLVQTIK